MEVEDGKLTGVVDWTGAGIGPRSFDVSWCRLDLYLLHGEPADAFSADPERLWPAVLRRQGGELAYVATYPDDPGLN